MYTYMYTYMYMIGVKVDVHCTCTYIFRTCLMCICSKFCPLSNSMLSSESVVMVL